MNETRPPTCGKAVMLCFWVFALLLGISAARADRTELDLGGSWQFQKVNQLAYPPTNSWQTMTVPGFLSGFNYEHAWFRCRFALPVSMAGTELKLRFGGVKYNAQIWLNGAFIGGYLNGYEPFDLDITTTALVGQTNELVVGVTDWTALFSTPVDFSSKAADQDARNFVRTNILGPIGGRYELYGVWQPVKVLSVPAVSIDDVFVIPSVRTQQLTARITLRNDTGAAQTVSLTNRVVDGTNAVLSFPVQQVTVPAFTNLQLDATAPWPGAHLWTHLDPYLFRLETSLSSSYGTDQIRTRFGFREFWTQNGRFYLNGVPINLLASATWPPSDLMSTGQIAQVLRDVKAGNNVAIRFHTQPWDEPWYEQADEIGLLIVEECAVWCDPWAYKLSDSMFWTNYSRHLSAAVKRDRNHPAIVLWSLENEILHCGGARAYSATEAQLAAMGRLVKAADPTRPITYEADLDPGGVADAVGLHYPHEYPDYQVWPNAAWWMNQSISRDWVPGGQWIWDRAKPLYIGEFLWVPNISAGAFTILFGDDAYFDSAYYRNLAKGLTWRMQIEAYRAYGVNGICPWTMFEDPAVIWGQFDLHPAQNYLYQAQKAAYDPNAVFPEEYNTRFFAGETASRTLRIYNDRMATNDLTLRWRAGGGAWQSISFALPPAGQRRDTNSFQVPAVPGPFPLDFELRDAANNLLFTNTIACTALGRTTLTLPAGLRAAIYDPRGSTTALLSRFGLPLMTVTNLRTANYDQFNLLLIGRDALTNETLPELGRDTLAAKWQNFASHGGWCLILEQTNYPAYLPNGLQLQNFDASFAFPNPDHPVTQGLTTDDLRWWADDNRLVSKAIRAPTRGNFRLLAGIGSPTGLDYAAAVEVPVGTGGFLCSQLLLVQRFDLEPLAGVLLQRLLNYCGSNSGHLLPRSGGLLAEPASAAASSLAGLGFQAENLSGRVTNCDPALHSVLVVAGNNTAWQEATAQLASLTNYVLRGGKLILHRPTSAFLAAAQPVLFPELDYADITLGAVLRRDHINATVRIANNDVYWIQQAGASDQPEVVSTNVASRYYRQRFSLVSYNTIQVENMPIHTTGIASSGGWWLYANGQAAQDISVAQSGTYLFNVSAKGTPLGGVGPHLALKIDGLNQDGITLPTNQLGQLIFYTLSADLTAGTHQLAVAFDNDAYALPEDRNLFLDEIHWGRDSDASPATLLTKPGAVAQVRRGNGLVILDEITWENETLNVAKAGRYASSLLTALGASLRLPASLTLEAEFMSNVTVSAYSASGGLAYLNSNGRIESKVSVTTSGTYLFEVVAGGTAAQGVLPQVAITVDGASRTNWFLTTTGSKAYTFRISLTAGVHIFGLAFLNDFYAPPEDRNAWFDRVTITPDVPPRIAGLNADLLHHIATVQWEAIVGKSYEIQATVGLDTPWQSITTIAALGNIATWQDVGAISGNPPFLPASPCRYYRIRQVTP